MGKERFSQSINQKIIIRFQYTIYELLLEWCAPVWVWLSCSSRRFVVVEKHSLHKCSKVFVREIKKHKNFRPNILSVDGERNERSWRGDKERETYLFASLGLLSTTTTTGTCRSFMNKFFTNEKNFKTNETIANESFRRGSLIKEK